MLSRRSTPSRRGLPRRTLPESRAIDHSSSVGLSSPRSSAFFSAARTAASGVEDCLGARRPETGLGFSWRTLRLLTAKEVYVGFETSLGTGVQCPLPGSYEIAQTRCSIENL